MKGRTLKSRLVCYLIHIQMQVGLHGGAKNVDIRLSEDLVTLDKTYISLASQRTIKIHNDSEIPVKFAWKSYGNSNQEGEERARLRSGLLQMKQEEEYNIRVGLAFLSRLFATLSSSI